MIEIIYEQSGGSIISEITSGGSHHRTTDVFIYRDNNEFYERTLVADLPVDMRCEAPTDSFNILSALKLIPKLRPYVQDKKLGLIIKD